MRFTRQKIFRPAGLFLLCLPLYAAAAAAHIPDKEYLDDRAALDALQADAFRFFWEDSEPESGMAYEASIHMEPRPIAVGGTGFGVAALVAAVDRGWVDRGAAVSRLMKMLAFLRDRTQRGQLHGAFPHWLDGATGRAMSFGERDGGADLVETSFLMQGLLIARAYFNGPGVERRMREAVTGLWEDVEWDWFTNNEESGLYWHWDSEGGFYNGLKILGYNECLITYVLAASSPTHPISRKAYDHWTSGKDYLPRVVNGYLVEASPPCGSPLFTAQYSFIGLNPKKLADDYVRRGYFIRGAKQTLANRGYCLYDAPEENGYSESFWGLSSGQTRNGYAASHPCSDNRTVAPTAAIGSMPFTPFYSLQVLRNLAGGLRERVWGEYGPYDGISLAEDWVSDRYLAINQLPMACMAENYRSGLLWKLFMSDKDVEAGLARAGFRAPAHAEGFPEIATVFRKEGGRLIADAHDAVRHPDSGMYEIPYFAGKAGPVAFTMTDGGGNTVFARALDAAAGENTLRFPRFARPDGETLMLRMAIAGNVYFLAVRLH